LKYLVNPIGSNKINEGLALTSPHYRSPYCLLKTKKNNRLLLKHFGINKYTQKVIHVSISNLFIFLCCGMEIILTAVEQFVVDFVLKTRLEKNLTQENISYILGVDKSFINRIENHGNRAKYNLNHINILADHWGISPREFLPKEAFPVPQA
jgi:hypothetical protein